MRFSFSGLGNGAHVVQVAPYRGRALIDSFIAPGEAPFYTPPARSVIVRYEEDDPALRYNGVPFEAMPQSWATGSNSYLSAGYGAWSRTANDTASLTFNGTWAQIGLMTSMYAGQAEIFIDGTSQGVVDTYSASLDQKSLTYGGLSAGTHTISIKVLGTHQANSGDHWIYLDSIDVWDGAAIARWAVPGWRPARVPHQ